MQKNKKVYSKTKKTSYDTGKTKERSKGAKAS